MTNLAPYLKNRVPEGMAYSDVVQLCFRLYCTVDGVPKGRLPLSKETLSEAFSELGSVGWVRGGDVDEVATAGHWLAVIGVVLKGPAIVNMSRGKELAHQVGFATEMGAS